MNKADMLQARTISRSASAVNRVGGFEGLCGMAKQALARRLIFGRFGGEQWDDDQLRTGLLRGIVGSSIALAARRKSLRAQWFSG